MRCKCGTLIQCVYARHAALNATKADTTTGTVDRIEWCPTCGRLYTSRVRGADSRTTETSVPTHVVKWEKGK